MSKARREREPMSEAVGEFLGVQHASRHPRNWDNGTRANSDRRDPVSFGKWTGWIQGRIQEHQGLRCQQRHRH